MKLVQMFFQLIPSLNFMFSISCIMLRTAGSFNAVYSLSNAFQRSFYRTGVVKNNVA